MKQIDLDDLKKNTSKIIDSLKKEDIVLTKDGKPVAIIKKFNDPIISGLPKEVYDELLKSDKNCASQYAAMLSVWGDPHCDLYDEAFMDD